MQSRNANELEANVRQRLGNIPVQRCEKLIKSMPRRIHAVMKAHGGYTKY